MSLFLLLYQFRISLFQISCVVPKHHSVTRRTFCYCHFLSFFSLSFRFSLLVFRFDTILFAFFFRSAPKKVSKQSVSQYRSVCSIEKGLFRNTTRKSMNHRLIWLWKQKAGEQTKKRKTIYTQKTNFVSKRMGSTRTNKQLNKIQKAF
jgi:hypothetical protein